MEAPLTVKRELFRQKLADLAGAAELPAFVVRECLEGLTDNYKVMEQIELQRDAKAHQERIERVKEIGDKAGRKAKAAEPEQKEPEGL